MKKIIGILICMMAVNHLIAQSNPQIDRPVQQCISAQSDKIQVIKPNFSIGSWLGKLIQTCENLQATSGKAGGPQVVSLLKMEKELDDLIAIADDCDILKNPEVKQLLTEIKTICTEKQKVENFKTDTGDKAPSDNIFEDDKEITTMTISRPAAGKIKSKAEKIKKILKK